MRWVSPAGRTTSTLTNVAVVILGLYCTFFEDFQYDDHKNLKQKRFMSLF